MANASTTLPDDDEHDELPDDEDAYDVTLTSVYLGEDGWPAPAATFALSYLPEDLDDIGDEIEHFPFVPTLDINRATEADLVETPATPRL